MLCTIAMSKKVMLNAFILKFLTSCVSRVSPCQADSWEQRQKGGRGGLRHALTVLAPFAFRAPRGNEVLFFFSP